MVLKINSYKAAIKYGKNTQWCITGTNTYETPGFSSKLVGAGEFDIHTSHGESIYYYIKKNSKQKYALVFKDLHNWVLFDSGDWVDAGEGQLLRDSPNKEGMEDATLFRELPTISGLPNFKEWKSEN